jgi:hypothetical protein
LTMSNWLVANIRLGSMQTERDAFCSTDAGLAIDFQRLLPPLHAGPILCN